VQTVAIKGAGDKATKAETIDVEADTQGSSRAKAKSAAKS